MKMTTVCQSRDPLRTENGNLLKELYTHKVMGLNDIIVLIFFTPSRQSVLYNYVKDKRTAFVLSSYFTLNILLNIFIGIARGHSLIAYTQ